MRLRHLALAAALLLPACPAAAQEAPPHIDETPPPAKTSPAAPLSAKTAAPLPAKAAAPLPAKPGPAVKNDGKRHLRSLDENHDGRVTLKEYLARAKEKFAELDLDHDGTLSPRELDKATQAARAKRDEARRRAGKPPISKEADQARAPMLSGRDQNGDGRITLNEYLAGREQSFAQLDKNRDGVISREESKAEKGRILARRTEIKAEKKAVAQRQVERQAVRDEKTRAAKRRQARHAELQAEREAKTQRRTERMARKAGEQWELAPEAAALAPEQPAP